MKQQQKTKQIVTCPTMAATKAEILENIRNLPNPGQDAETLLAKVLPGELFEYR